MRKNMSRGRPSCLCPLIIAVALVVCVFLASTTYLNRMLQEQATALWTRLPPVKFETLYLWGDADEYPDVADFRDNAEYHRFRDRVWQGRDAVWLLKEIRNQYPVTTTIDEKETFSLDDVEFGTYVGGGMIAVVLTADVPKLHEHMRSPLQPRQMELNILPGDRVVAAWSGNQEWYDATVKKVHNDGTYDVEYNYDGVIETLKRSKIIKLREEAKNLRPYVVRLSSGVEYMKAYVNVEIEILRWLNVQPRHPAIPRLRLVAKDIKNPFADVPIDKLRLGMGISDSNAKWLKRKALVTVQVHERFMHTGLPRVWDSADATGLLEFARFAFSLMDALVFVHARNVIVADIKSNNVMYDNRTGTAFLPDFNGARIFAPQVLLYQYGQYNEMMPPEYWRNENATHVTVSAFDIWTSSLVLAECLCGYSAQRCPMPNNVRPGSMLWNAHDLIFSMQNPDPHQRPTASELLQHPVFHAIANKP